MLQTQQLIENSKHFSINTVLVQVMLRVELKKIQMLMIQEDGYAGKMLILMEVSERILKIFVRKSFCGQLKKIFLVSKWEYFRHRLVFDPYRDYYYYWLGIVTFAYGYNLMVKIIFLIF